MENGVKKGDTLCIPIVENNVPKVQGKKTTHVVKPKETLYGISKQYGVAEGQLLAANPHLSQGLRINDTLLIDYSTIYTTKQDIKASKKSYKIVYLLPFSSASDEVSGTSIDMFIDFYRGSLIALDELKKEWSFF